MCYHLSLKENNSALSQMDMGKNPKQDGFIIDLLKGYLDIVKDNITKAFSNFHSQCSPN